MKLSRIAIAASFSMLAVLTAAQVHAEEYQGVLQTHSTLDRSDVRSQAVAAAHAPNPYSEGASSAVAVALASPRDRATVQAEARALAHAPNQNLYVEAFVNSRVPAGYSFDGALPTRQAGIADGVTLR